MDIVSWLSKLGKWLSSEGFLTLFFSRFFALNDTISTKQVYILNPQVISFQTRYRSSKSIKAKLQNGHFVLFKLGPNCPPGVLSWDLGQLNLFGCCLVNSCGGLFRWTFWLNGSPGKEHHARLVQDLSNWQV